jgi:hypothetical protein
MPGTKGYTAAGAFRKALEDRLKRIAHEEKVDVKRLRRQVAFDRLLARLFLPDQPSWVLKGGYALELLFDTARATRKKHSHWHYCGKPILRTSSA